MKTSGDLRRTIALLRRFAMGQRITMVFAVLLLAAEAATAVYEPVLIGDIIKVLTGDLKKFFFTTDTNTMIGLLALGLVGLTAVNSLSDSLTEIALAKVGRTLGFNLRQALFAHLQTLSLAFHMRRRVGDVLTRITADVTVLEDFVVRSLSDLIGSLLLIVGTLSFLLSQSPQVTLLALVIVPVLATVSSFFASRIKVAAKDLRAREGDLASSAQEMLTSIGVVQVYGRNRYELERFAEQSRSAMAAVFRTARLEALFSFTVSVLEATVIAVVVWVGAVVIGAPTITAGTLVTFVLLIQQMFKPTRRIIKEWNTIAKLYASVDRVSELLDRRPAVQDGPDAFPAPRLRGEIEFDEVSFAYQAGADENSDESDTRLALDTLSLRIPAGEVVALVGHSGAGKSTIAQLLPRLYDPHAGAVLIDGYDVRAFTLDSLRAQISMVMQEAVLFGGTVAANIAYGRPDASMDDIVLAATQANAHDFIMALPQGYDSMLGERAATLSGGQRQRLSIARAFVRNAPILVLDEPTTGLDAESSDLVLEALQVLLRGRTALIISHDFNLIRDVDRVLVLSAGRILEDGSPADLLARGGLYADLYERQFGARRVAEELVGAPTVADVATASDFDAEATGPGRRAFETALMRALPLPASPAAFRQLSGHIAWGGFPGVADDESSAPTGPDGPMQRLPEPRSATVGGPAKLPPSAGPALERWLPGLREALDAPAMTPVLHGLVADGWALEWCTPGKALVDPKEGVSLRYNVGLRDLAAGRVVERLVGGYLFPSNDLAEQWHEHLAPLAAAAAGRQDMIMFARPLHHVSSLRLVLHAFPLDADLPGLLAATDTAHLGETLGPILTRPIDGLLLQECRPHVVQYARRGRCVLRYDVLWQLGASSRALKQVAYGKVYGDEQGAGVGPAVDAVRGYVESPAQPGFHFLVPRFLGYLPELRLAMLEALPGTPEVPSLVRRHVAGGGPDPRQVTLGAALETCALIAASLHGSALDIGGTRTLRGEIDAVSSAIEGISSLAPDVADALQSRLFTARAAGGDSPPAVGFSHGDLTPAQVLFDGPLSGLVDLDTVGRAEPALDLGQFVGYLELMVGKAHAAKGLRDPSDGEDHELSRTFLSAYLRAAGELDTTGLLDRVSAYRTVSLTRVALRSWLQLKPARLQLALRLLDDSDPLRQHRGASRPVP